MSDDKCPEFSHQTGASCLLPAGHEGKHESIAYPYDSHPRRYSWENYPDSELVAKESRRKLGT